MNNKEFKAKLIEILDTVDFVEHDFDEGIYKLEMQIRIFEHGNMQKLGVYVGKGTLKNDE